MIKKKILIICFLVSFIALFFILQINGILITNFSDGTYNFNLSFSGNENITRNITIPKNAVVTNAVMNLSGLIFSNNFTSNNGTLNTTGIPTPSQNGWTFFDTYLKDGYWYVVSRDSDQFGQNANNSIFRFNASSLLFENVVADIYDGEPTTYYARGIYWNGSNWMVTFQSPSYVFVYDNSFNYISNLSLNGMASYASGITSNGSLYFISDYSSDKVYSYSYNFTNANINYSVDIDAFDIDYISNELYYILDISTTGNDFLDIYNQTGSFKETYALPSNSYMSFYDVLTGRYYITSQSLNIYLINLIISNPFISINSTQIFNYTGTFNQTNNQTLNFNTTLNTALNSGACDCVGCSLSGNNCTIPITFHSDTAGILQYSDIQIDYTPAPITTLISPSNNSWSSSEKTFVCNATDEIQLSNATFYLWNSTSVVNSSENKTITGISNSTNFTIIIPRTDTYKWNCKVCNNNSRCFFADSNFTLNVDIDSPIITLNYPSNNGWLNSQTNINFNYTPEHSTQTIETCELWGNWTGSFIKNLSDSTITESIINSFSQNITSDNSFIFNIKCNSSETGNYAFSNSNFTFNIDTIYPNITINSITTTTGSQTISFNSTEQDKNTISCKYSIFNSSGDIDGINNNISYTCGSGSSHSATTSAYGTYNLTIYSKDLANNENSSTLSFTTSASAPTSPGGGGGGTIILGEGNWTMQVSDNIFSYEIFMPIGTSRQLSVEFENFGEEEREITLSCEDVEGNICELVTLHNETIILPVLKDMKTEKSFIITTPEENEEGDYSFNIVATDEESRQKSITVFLSLGGGGILTNTITKLALRTESGFPYIFIYLPILLVTLFSSVIIIPKNFPIKTAWVFLSVLLIPFSIIYFI